MSSLIQQKPKFRLLPSIGIYQNWYYGCGEHLPVKTKCLFIAFTQGDINHKLFLIKKYPLFFSTIQIDI